MTEVALLISSAGGIGGVAAFITSLQGRRDQKTITKSQARITAEVKNSHGTNLRDDLDTVIKGVAKLEDIHRESVRRMDHQFEELRDDLQDERKERRMDEEHHREEHRRIWKKLE